MPHLRTRLAALVASVSVALALGAPAYASPDAAEPNDSLATRSAGFDAAVTYMGNTLTDEHDVDLYEFDLSRWPSPGLLDRVAIELTNLGAFCTEASALQIDGTPIPWSGLNRDVCRSPESAFLQLDVPPNRKFVLKVSAAPGTPAASPSTGYLFQLNSVRGLIERGAVAARFRGGGEPDDLNTVFLNDPVSGQRDRPIAAVAGDQARDVLLGWHDPTIWGGRTAAFRPGVSFRFVNENTSGGWGFDWALVGGTAGAKTYFAESLFDRAPQQPVVGQTRSVTVEMTGRTIASDCGVVRTDARCLALSNAGDPWPLPTPTRLPSPSPTAVPQPSPSPAPQTPSTVEGAFALSKRGRHVHGWLASTNPQCLRRASVTLRKRGSKATFGKTTTRPDGRWSITRKTRLTGRVYATVAARTTGYGVRCAAATLTR